MSGENICHSLYRNKPKPQLAPMRFSITTKILPFTVSSPNNYFISSLKNGKENCFPLLTASLRTGEPFLPPHCLEIPRRASIQCIFISTDNVPLLYLSSSAILFTSSSDLDLVWHLANELRLGISLVQYHAPFRANRYRKKVQSSFLFSFVRANTG